MACNENIIKNIANEITRNCQSQNVTVDSDFVFYIIKLLLLNPRYGKLISKTINRKNLEVFVNKCVSWLIHGGISINTMKMQYVMESNYDTLQSLIDKHLTSIDTCLQPLVNEILDAEPQDDDEAELKKLFRKISIYIVMASGLGNPGIIMTLKEGMASLESVFSLDDLKTFVALLRADKVTQLLELFEIVSGVRLFNRDCKKGGESIPDLPLNLVDASKACLLSLSNSLISVMQRVNTLTTAIEDTVLIDDETGNVSVYPLEDLTCEEYQVIFDLLASNRQYEVFIRFLLSDVEIMLHNGLQYVERVKLVLEELHSAVIYKSAVPVDTVFPLFIKLWRVWRSMQNYMYLVSTVNKLMSTLSHIHNSEQMKIPSDIVDKLLRGKRVITDQERMSSKVCGMANRLSLHSFSNYVPYSDTTKKVQYLGFCAVCLCLGALVPCHFKIGLIKHNGSRYGFCNVKMAAKFSRDPDRYIKEVINYARNHPDVINLLNITDEVSQLRDVDNLVTIHLPKTKVSNKDIQTETHPVDSYIEKNYTWCLWKWKRRACQWATIVNCQTHSTQTIYSHLRSDVHCQTVHMKDKCSHTKKDRGVNTGPDYMSQKIQAKTFTACTWPCVSTDDDRNSSTISIGERLKFA